MKIAHYVEMRVFSKEEDNEETIESKIKELFPFDFDKEKIDYTKTTADGFDDKKIRVLTVIVNKDRHINKVLELISSKLDREKKDMLLSQIDTRLDSSLNFFFRLDKGMLLNNEYMITDSGNCFRFKIALAAYPHRKEIAEEIIKRILH